MPSGCFPFSTSFPRRESVALSSLYVPVLRAFFFCPPVPSHAARCSTQGRFRLDFDFDAQVSPRPSRVRRLHSPPSLAPGLRLRPCLAAVTTTKPRTFSTTPRPPHTLPLSHASRPDPIDTMASGSTSSNVVGVHYRVGKKIGEGSFGVIFEGTNLLNQQQVAIKFEPRKSDAPQLRDEYRTYKILVGCRKYRPCSPFTACFVGPDQHHPVYQHISTHACTPTV
jgi:hypothetical protein